VYPLSGSNLAFVSSTPPNKTARPLRLRLATWLFPPAGLVLLWLEPVSFFRKLFGTLGIALYTVVYLAVILLALTKSKLVHVEWQGGFPPKLTRKVTLPDYDAVERSRAAQAKAEPVAPSARTGSTYWSDFRGPKRDGHYTEQPVLTTWPPGGPKVLWRQPIGGGYASFVIAKGLAYTIEQRREKEVVAAYDLETGREVWSHSYPAHFQESMGGEGPRATPTWHDGKLYALGGEGDFHCFDALTGKVLWQRNILHEAKSSVLMFGTAYSPLIVDDKVILIPGGSDGWSVVAYHKDTGDLIWRAQDDKTAYTSPVLVEFAGQRQMIIVSATRVKGVTVEDGKVLWEHPWTVQYENAIAQPVLLGQDRFLLSGGYGKGCAAFQVTRTGDKFTVQELWRNRSLKNKFTSSVIHEGHIYGLDESILTCLNAETGKPMWKDGRYEYGQILLASGHIIVLCGDGDLALVQATPDKWTELARVPLLNGKTWNHPAMSEGKLLVRNAVEMICLDLRISAKP
jgi:outer membrane protein assembly factor BamB